MKKDLWFMYVTHCLIQKNIFNGKVTAWTGNPTDGQKDVQTDEQMQILMPLPSQRVGA